jgi:periplasmic copper chaperone A
MRTTRPLALLLTGTGLALATAFPASAHVTVQGQGATQGGFAKITFRVPTEEAVPTTRLQIVFPTDAPLSSVRTKPHAGWTAVIAKAPAVKPFTVFGEEQTEQVASVTFTAAPGAGIKPAEFDEFEISAGPLPEVDQMVFKALQTYADGTVVRWIEEAVEGGAEPEKPAPVLALAKAGAEGDSHGGGDTSHGGDSTGDAATVDAATVASTERVSDGSVFGGFALGLAGIALLVSLFAAFKAGKRSAG